MLGTWRAPSGDNLIAAGGGLYVTVAHPVVRESNQFRTTPVVTVDSTAEPVTAAVAMRVSADARHGIVALTGSGAHPLTDSVPASYRTLTVNTSTDATPTTTTENACRNNTSGCTLRAAVTVANLDRSSTGKSKVDTISIPSGTYTLSAYNVDSSGTTRSTDFNRPAPPP